MKLSDTGLPLTRQEEIKEICRIFNVQVCSIVEHTFTDLGRKEKKCVITTSQEVAQS